jgi:glycosyltransferase involved in cell wall biosynthesis
MTYNVAFNALSASHHSAVHVLRGHIMSVARGASENVRLHLIATAKQIADWQWRKIAGLTCIEANEIMRSAAVRFICERRLLESHIRSLRLDFIFSPNGICLDIPDVAEAILAQNPYPMVEGIQHHGISDWLKCRVQKNEFRRTQNSACIKYYNSHYMRATYRSLGNSESRGDILHQGVYRDGDPLEGWPQQCNDFSAREKTVLFVSALTRHKSVENLLGGFQLVANMDPQARLKIIGRETQRGYLAAIKKLARHLGILDRVEFAGFVSVDELTHSYKTSRVYCSLSQCESFGIPAVEAQLHGTPAVVGDSCAPPEIIGEGGYKVQPADHQETARRLLALLNDREVWTGLSQKARSNARRFEWGRCSKPLVSVINELAAKTPDTNRRCQFDRASI